MGESLRGNAMDFVDSATGTAQRGHGATVKGEAEAQAGIANMENRGPPVGTAPNNVNVGTGGVGASTGTAGTTNMNAGSAAPGAGFGTKGDLPPGSSTGY